MYALEIIFVYIKLDYKISIVGFVCFLISAMLCTYNLCISYYDIIDKILIIQKLGFLLFGDF